MVEVAEKQVTLICHDISQIPEIAREIVDFAGDCRVILFEGELGSGKTTVIKSICNYLEVIDNVTSPTFSIINQYKTRNNKYLFHFDFYRIIKVQEALDIGSDEYFYSGDLCLIEWPSKVEPIIPSNHVIVSFEVEANETRILKLEYYV